jgi:pimeloyl-ACP methyl ester carboxylesterase
MFRKWKNNPALGLSLGVGLVGGLAFALRYAAKKAASTPIPDSISPAIFATRVSQTTYGEMIYHTAGAGNPLVFLHGAYLGASSYEWSKVYPYFTSNWQVLAPDLIGFGESQRPSAALDADQHACVLRECFFEASGGRPAVMVASGVSAELALLVASKHPESVARLILYQPNHLMERGRRPRGMGLVGRIPLLRGFIYRNYLASEPFLKVWLSRFGLSSPKHLTDEMLSVIVTCARQYGAHHAILGLFSGKLSFPLLQRLPRIPHPVTILWPEESPLFPFEYAERMVKLLPRGNLRLIPYQGVLAPLEDPEGFQKLIEETLVGELPQAGNN